MKNINGLIICCLGLFNVSHVFLICKGQNYMYKAIIVLNRSKIHLSWIKFNLVCLNLVHDMISFLFISTYSQLKYLIISWQRPKTWQIKIKHHELNYYVSFLNTVAVLHSMEDESSMNLHPRFVSPPPSLSFSLKHNGNSFLHSDYMICSAKARVLLSINGWTNYINASQK